jgi:hypothetical protein
MAVGERSGGAWRGRVAGALFVALVALTACRKDTEPQVQGRRFERATTTSTAVAALADSTVTVAPATAAPATVATRANPPKPGVPAIQTSIGAATSGPTYNPMVFTVRVTGNLGPVKAVTLDFGDGVSTSLPVAAGSVADPTCTDAEAKSDSAFAVEFSHGFRRPGTYPVRITSVDLDCHPDVAPQGPAFTANITAGEVHSNGPALPTVRNCVINTNSFCASADGRHATAFAGGLGDSDGYVLGVKVDWGDGTSPVQTGYPLRECQDPGTRWPSSDRSSASWEHTYARSGSFTITLTVFSSGCDGRDLQEAPFTEQLVVD